MNSRGNDQRDDGGERERESEGGRERAREGGRERGREGERGVGVIRKNITERDGTTNSKSESAFFLCWLCFGLFFCLRPGF